MAALAATNDCVGLVVFRHVDVGTTALRAALLYCPLKLSAHVVLPEARLIGWFVVGRITLRFIASNEAEIDLRAFLDCQSARLGNRTSKSVRKEFVREVLSGFSENIFEGVALPADRAGHYCLGIRISREFHSYVAARAENWPRGHCQSPSGKGCLEKGQSIHRPWFVN
jgi:hypothetical protein